MSDFFVLQMSMWTLKSSIFFLQMGHSFTSFCSGIPRNSHSTMTILSLGIESLGSVGMALSHVPACFSMEESTIILFVESKAVVELLEGLTCNLFSKGVLVLETWVAIQKMYILESADFTTHL